MLKIFSKRRKKKEAGVKIDMIEIFIQSYLHIAERIFSYLDLHSLESAKLASLSWGEAIDNVIHKRIRRNWKSGVFSFMKIVIGDSLDSAWKIKSDYKNIFIGESRALKIYERQNCRLKQIIDFHYPNSKDFDFNDSIFYLTGYFMYNRTLETRSTTESERKIVVYDRKSYRKISSYKFLNDDFEYSMDKVYLGFDDSIYVSLNGHTKIVVCKNGYKNCIITFPKIPLMRMKIYFQYSEPKILCLRTPLYDVSQNNELSSVHLFRKPLPIHGRKDGLYHSCSQINATLGVELYKPTILSFEDDYLTFIDVLPDYDKIHLKNWVLRKLNLKDKTLLNTTNMLSFSVTSSIGRAYLVRDSFLLFELLDDRFRLPNQIRTMDLKNELVKTAQYLDDVTTVFEHIPTTFGSYEVYLVQYFDPLTLLTSRDPIFKDLHINLYDMSVPNMASFAIC